MLFIGMNNKIGVNQPAFFNPDRYAIVGCRLGLFMTQLLVQVGDQPRWTPMQRVDTRFARGIEERTDFEPALSAQPRPRNGCDTGRITAWYSGSGLRQHGQYDIRPGVLLTKEILFMGESGSLPGQTGGPMFRAYDKRNGKVLREQAMPALVTGAPMTCTHKGRQYVVVTVSQNGRPAEMIALTLDGQSESGAPPIGGVSISAGPVTSTASVAAIQVTPAEHRDSP